MLKLKLCLNSERINEMAKKKVTDQAPATDWENTPSNYSTEDFDILPSGLPPLWKPEAGNVIYFRPMSVELFKVKKNKQKKGKGKKSVNFAIAGILVGGDANCFFNGNSGTAVRYGDRVTVGSSYNLIGENKLITEDGELSPMSKRIMEEEKAFMIRFDGKIKQPNNPKMTVNQFTVGVPKGYRG
jgi:hypothetical protein